MPEAGCFRQIEEKHVSQEVTTMLWSPKMDLVALATVLGEVVLHRLSWQKVWTLAPPGEEIKVRGLAWRPDGKVLAVGYSTGTVQLCDVENSDCIHSITLPHGITCLQWVAEQNLNDESNASQSENYCADTSDTFLPKLQPLNKSYGTIAKGQSEDNVEDGKKLKGQTELNVLVIGNTLGTISLYAYGIFPVATIDMTSATNTKIGNVYCGGLSQDLRLLTLMVETLQGDAQTSDISILSIDTSLLASRHRELRILALKFGQILTLLSYAQATIRQMKEAWEDILLEMDTKLRKFAEEKYKLVSGTVSNDFLELLMFGTPSSELQSFLLHELTEKGLKKLGHSIETSYSNIQKLVLKHLQSVGQSLVYYLTELKGMSLWYDRFGVLGLSPQCIQDALNAAGTFMLKSVELQQVIDGSMKNFKAFFRWLYVVIQRLSNEPIPPELSKMTQQDFNFVAEFLKENFTEEQDGSSGSAGFKLERVGQYLKDEDLAHPPDGANNPWTDLLNTTPLLKDSLYPCAENKSLTQVFSDLKDSIDAAVNKPSMTIGQSLFHGGIYCLFKQPSETSGKSDKLPPYKPTITQQTVSTNGQMNLFTAFLESNSSCEHCYILRQSTQLTHGAVVMEMVRIEFKHLGPIDLNSSSAARRFESYWWQLQSVKAILK
ncbi:unnamed protein product [Owenia fusiformis]|uniref:Anaphase-promoting complex subunit 4 n=1 Tax=Owenia fusiformis TaxID=6347 RepID=A0A8S4NQY7_OWEFU|nr:unnamed protein product [Owenia fusiformis]